MYRPAYIAWTVLAWVVGIHAVPSDVKPLCPIVKEFVTGFGEQQEATCFCASYLYLRTTQTTFTTTATQTVTKTATRRFTATATTDTTITAIVTVTATNAAATVKSAVTETDTTIYSGTLTTTKAIATITDFTSTATETDTTTITSVVTKSITTTFVRQLSNCSPPLPTILSKREEIQGRSIPKPQCLSHWSDSHLLSYVCSCLSIPETITRTVSVTTEETKTRRISQTATLTATQTATATSTDTHTVKVTPTITIPTTVVVTESTTAATVVDDTTTTISLDTTTVTQVAITLTQTSTISATATRYANFGIFSSKNYKYGAAVAFSGFSGSGIYFNAGDIGSAATFSFDGDTLYYDGQYINTYQASSGNYFVVVERPFPQFGYVMDCTLDTNGGSAFGCELQCNVNGNGLTEPASGNDDINYNGAWGFQGSVDQFTLYAVGLS